MFCGMWLFLRRAARRSDAAVLGSLLFTFCGFNLLHFVHPNAVAIIAHIPWLLWAIDIVLIDSKRRKVAAAAAAIAILTGSQLLLGYPQYVWFSLLAEAGYTAFVAYASRRVTPAAVATPASPCADCVGCTSPGWPRRASGQSGGHAPGRRPVVAHLRRPQREHATDRRRRVGPNRLRPPAEPDPIGRPVPLYRPRARRLHPRNEALPWRRAADVDRLVDRRSATPRPRCRCWPRATAWFGGVALLLAMGEFGHLYRLQSFLPLVNRFRCPCRYLVLFQFGAAVLAAIGFMLLARAYQRAREGEPKRSQPALSQGLPPACLVPYVQVRGALGGGDRRRLRRR